VRLHVLLLAVLLVAFADGVNAGDLVPAAAWRAAHRSTGGTMLRTAAASTVPVMLSSAAPGVRVRAHPGRLWLGWPPPMGTVVEARLGDLFGGDPTVPSPISGDPGDVDRVPVCWDGHHQVEWVDPTDLVPAAAVVAVA